MRPFLSLLAASFLGSMTAMAATVVIEGTIDKVNEGEKEIYVLSNGKKSEFYFTKDTKIESKGHTAEFSTLKKGLKVKVTAEKKGKRLEPQVVEITE